MALAQRKSGQDPTQKKVGANGAVVTDRIGEHGLWWTFGQVHRRLVAVAIHCFAAHSVAGERSSSGVCERVSLSGEAVLRVPLACLRIPLLHQRPTRGIVRCRNRSVL